VPPQRVEAVVAGTPGVAEAAVVGVPDAERGERVVAVVVAASGEQVPSLDDVRAHAAQWLPGGWLPREAHVVDRLPLLASGKVDRAAVRQLVARTGAAP